MAEEYNTLLANGIWVLVPTPHHLQNLVRSKWVYRVKYQSDGFAERYKERLAAQGFHK